MTDFYYNNEERLLQLQGEILGDEGELWRIITPQNVDVYKFLISMSIERGLHINHKAYMKVKEYAVYADCTIQNRVFFKSTIHTQGISYTSITSWKGQAKTPNFLVYTIPILAKLRKTEQNWTKRRGMCFPAVYYSSYFTTIL